MRKVDVKEHRGQFYVTYQMLLNARACNSQREAFAKTFGLESVGDDFYPYDVYSHDVVEADREKRIPVNATTLRRAARLMEGSYTLLWLAWSADCKYDTNVHHSAYENRTKKQRDNYDEPTVKQWIEAYRQEGYIE